MFSLDPGAVVNAKLADVHRFVFIDLIFSLVLQPGYSLMFLGQWVLGNGWRQKQTNLEHLLIPWTQIYIQWFGLSTNKFKLTTGDGNV